MMAAVGQLGELGMYDQQGFGAGGGSSPPASFHILTEAGDNIATEGGDLLETEAGP